MDIFIGLKLIVQSHRSLERLNYFSSEVDVDTDPDTQTRTDLTSTSGVESRVDSDVSTVK
jgi:hypothetical protein